MLMFLMPLVGIWALTMVFAGWKEPGRRKLEAIRVSLWLVTISAIVGTHFYYAESARSVANGVADAVVAYKEVHGVYPETIELVAPELAKPAKYWRVYYDAKGQEPGLIYPVTWAVFDTFVFNFTNHKWEYWAD